MTKQSSLEKIVEDFDPKSAKKIMTVAKLTEELKLIEARLKVLEGIDLDKQRIATTRKSLEKALCS